MHVHLGHIPRGKVVRTDAAGAAHVPSSCRRGGAVDRLSRCAANATLMNWCPDQGQDQAMRTDPFRYDENDIGRAASAAVRV